MTAPSVSVILPTHNRAGLLPRAIASVLQQTARDFELIVVDDGSGDGTRELVAACGDPRIVYLRHDVPRGDAGARNAGIARARGAWLAFQDSDDEWVPHSLARRLELAARADAMHAAVASALVRITPRAVELVEWPLAAGSMGPGDVDRPRFVAAGRAYLQSMLVRREAFDALGGFDTNLRARSDIDFCLRLCRRYRLLATPEVLALSYETEGSLSLDAGIRLADMRRLAAKHADLIAADRPAHARFRYDLARAELACDQRAASARTAARALALDPLVARAWALLLLAPLGARGLAWASALRRAGGRPS